MDADHAVRHFPHCSHSLEIAGFVSVVELLVTGQHIGDWAVGGCAIGQ